MAKSKKKPEKVIPNETIIRKIYVVRGLKVMLDFDLAALYEVETKAFNQAVKRNIDRFPDDFMFRLTTKEWIMMRSQIGISALQPTDYQEDITMRSQIVTSSAETIDFQGDEETKLQTKRKVTITPYAFTEHGVTMLASVLKSERAVKMSITVVRAFIELKSAILQYDELTKQLQTLKEHLGEHDTQLAGIYDAIENLLDKKAEEKMWEERERIGFTQKKN
jgi:phage regulator Rha-like protein